jgi:hypothetical protein
MATVKKLQGQKRALAREKAKLTKTIAEKIALAQEVNDDLYTTKVARNKQRRKRLADKPYDGALLKQLNEEIAILNERILEIEKAQNDRKSRLSKINKRIRAKINQIRNARQPRIIDLNLDFRAMSLQGSVDKVIGHYTAGPRDKDTKDAIRLCRLYHQMHLDNGWSGEAYMLCFTSDGNILLLRPAKYVGAHTLGYNTGSYGIMMHGTTGDKATEAQKKALRWWSENGDKSVMKSGQTKIKPKNIRWYGHNDFNATSCPGSFKTTYESKGNK